MERKRNIPKPVITRLPKYHRYLRELLINDVIRISSKQLAEKIGFSATQIRQDLNCLGKFGQQRSGYKIKELLNEISKVLGLCEKYKMVIVGAGNIGQAIASYTRFQGLEFKLVGIFDVNPKLIGLTIQNITVTNIDKLISFLKVTPTNIGIICVPKNNAQIVANMMVESGVKGIWNFAPVDLKVPEEIVLKNVNLCDSLLTLSYFMNNRAYL